MRFLRLMLAIVAAISVCPGSSAQAKEKSPVGLKIDEFKLHDFRGAVRELKEFSDSELVVVAFLGTECSLARLYGPRLAELAGQYETKRVAFVGIDANQQDTLAEMAQYARKSKIEFPFLKDPANVVADLFGALRTPEVFVLDKDRVIRYRGRIDDQFGIGFSRHEPKHKDLAAALDELLAGKEVGTSVTEAAGCHIGRVNARPARGDVTYAKNIASVVQKNCVACHRAGEVAPFALTSYEDVVNWSATVREVVEERRMPPWHADAEPGKFVNDRRLADADRKMLIDWIDNGMPEGDPSDLPVPATFSEGWQIAAPDLVFEMPEPFTVQAKGTVEYQYFPLPQTFDEDKWVVAGEARPGNRSVVHH